MNTASVYVYIYKYINTVSSAAPFQSLLNSSIQETECVSG